MNAAMTQPQPPERTSSSTAASSPLLSPPPPSPPPVPPRARYTVTCLVLGRPPSAAFLVNCADGALSLAQLARRIDSILHSTATPTSTPGEGGATYSGAPDGGSSVPATPPPLQLFLVVKDATHRLNLASSVLDPSDGRIRKILEKTSAGPAARAHELSALLGGGCVWVTGPLLSSAVRDVLGSNTDRDDAAVDFLVALDDSVPSGSGVDLASAGLPAYADIDGAPRQATVRSDDDPPSSKAVNGGALFDKEPPSLSQNVEAAPLMTPASGPGPSTPVACDLPEAVLSPLPPRSNKQKRMILIIIVVVVVIVVGISVAVVVSKRNAADSDSSTVGGALTSGDGSSSGSVGAYSSATETGSLGESGGTTSASAGTTDQVTTSATESGSSAVMSSTSSPGASAATSTTAQSTTSTSSTASSTCSQYQLDSFTSTTNNLGYLTGDDGTMKSISRSGNAVHFVPTSNSYYYEALLTDNGDGTCSAHQPAFNYLTFTITGAGSAVVDVITGCEGAYHYTSAFTASSSSTSYVVDILAVLGGSTSLAASLYSIAWEQYAVSSSTATWSLSGVYIVNDLAACGISATVLS
ncbi:hypothetical protein HK405_007984 [Cladochytrium tenue]|nr:hypothetical protein HK405_007984 [Cladochytrium tenue]